MLRSRLLIRQSIPPIVVTRTRRGAVLEAVKRGLGKQYVRGLVVVAVMLGGLASAAWQVVNQPPRAIPVAEVELREAKAFEAGREVAYEELSQGVVKVYEQGRADGRLEAASALRGGVR